MWLLLPVILGVLLATVVVWMIDMEDVHAGRTDTDCCLSFKQFKSFYRLNPDKWYVQPTCLKYDAHGCVFARQVRFRSWLDVLRYYFFAKHVEKKKRTNKADQNTLLVIQEIQKDIDRVKQQSEDQIERGRRRFAELWEEFTDQHGLVNAEDVLKMLHQVRKDLEGK